MNYALTHLTFLDDPTTYQPGTDEVCARVPANIASQSELMDFLQESLNLPAYFSASWYALSEALCNWEIWKTVPRRIVIIHTDVPFLRSNRKLWWLDVKGYVHALLESIALFHAKNTIETNPLKHRELVVIFPSRTYDELQAVFTRPPDWQLTLDFVDIGLLHIVDIDPVWSLVHQYLTSLDGLTAEVCTLSRSDIGTISVQYLRNTQAYCVKHISPDQRVSLFASSEEEISLPPTVSFALASNILETFFGSGQRLASLSWHVLSDAAYSELEAILDRSYYESDEEALLELAMTDGTRTTIGEGVKQAVYSREDAFSLEYWRGMLSQPDATLTKRLAALCVIGRSGLPDAPALLRPFLKSPVKQERWISARFFGLWQGEEALPILLSMLTDELPLATREQNTEHDGYWYDTWRLYAPRLLRKWQIPEVTEQLRKALATWVQAEPQFDPDIEAWKRPEEEICYELGYRGDLSALQGLSFEDAMHKLKLQTRIEQGHEVKKRNMDYQEEYDYRSGWTI